MRLIRIYYAAILCSCFVILPARAASSGGVTIADPACQTDLEAASPTSVKRLSLPLVDEKKKLIALTAVIPDFDPERDVVIGMRDRKHTYLINALIGRHDPGIFGGRGRFHDNTKVSRLTVSPGLIVRLRLDASMVRDIAEGMNRMRNLRNLTCTNTTARILSRAGVPGMNSFILTPVQMLNGFAQTPGVDARYFLVNASAENLEDFKDQVKVVGAKKKTTPPVDENQTRQNKSASCDDEDYFNCCMFTMFDLDSCTGTGQAAASPASECGASECGACESGACDSESDCGGSDSDCCG